MQATRTQAHNRPPQNWPFVDTIIGPLADWWRRHAQVRANQSQLDAMAPEELARVASDVGMPSSDLRALALHGSDAAELLDYRVESLGLHTSELAGNAPAQLRDMQRVCTMCHHKGRCGRDLAADSSDPVWRRYCPNEPSLSDLQHNAAH